MTARLEEILAVLQPNGDRIGMPKGQTRGMIVLAAHALLFNSQGDVLLTQRSTANLYGYWDVGITETIRIDETVIRGAKRGLYEELDISHRNMPWLTIIGKTNFEDGDFKRHVITYQSTYDGPLTPNPREIMALEWVPARIASSEIQNRTRLFRDLTAYLWTIYEHILVPEIRQV